MPLVSFNKSWKLNFKSMP